MSGGEPFDDDAPTATDRVTQLHDIAAEFQRCRDEQGVYGLVVEAAERVLAFDICGVDAVEDGRLVPVAVSEGMADAGYEATSLEDGGLAAAAHRTGEASVVDDVRDDERASPATEEYRSVLTVPVGDHAVLQAGSRAVGAFDVEDRELAELLAAHAEGTIGRIQAEQAVRERRETIEELHGIVAEMVACESEAAVYDLLVGAAERVLEFRVCTVLAGTDGETMTVRAASEDGLAPPVGQTVRTGEGVGGRTLATGESVLVRDVRESDLAEPYDDRYRSAVSVPMGSFGVVQAIATEVDAFDPDHLELAELLASQAAAVVTRLRAEAERRAERDSLRALFDNVPAPAVRFDLEDDAAVVREVNPAFEATFGYEAAELRGEDVDEYIVPEDDREAAAALNERLRAGEAFREELRRTTADGDVLDIVAKVVPVDPGGENVAGYAIYTDVTDRKRRERRLGALHDTSRELLTAAADEGAVFEIAVAAAREVLGLDLGAVFRRSDGELVPAAVSAAAMDVLEGGPPTLGPDTALWSALEEGEPRVVTDVDERYIADDAAVGALLVQPLGEAGVFVAGGRDDATFDEGTRELAGLLGTTVAAALERAEREARLRDREQELGRQNERLEEFASVVSHDLRTPLTTAKGNLDLVREGRTDRIDAVADAHDRMEQLVDDVLALAREGRVVGDPEPVDVARVARDAWAVVPADGGDLDVGDPPVVDADPDRLRQLLENLFRNAVEHGADDGDDGVTVTVDALAGAGDRTVGFVVADDGPGIPPDRRERVFERGVSTTEDGTGFGLAIVAETAEAHGWSVDCGESDAGGAAFRVRTD
jgi:PAS domain S-box-containing protein